MASVHDDSYIEENHITPDVAILESDPVILEPEPSRSASAKTSLFSTFSIEILWNIIGNLGATDLQALRLTSNHYAVIGRPLLCINVNVTETLASFQRLLLISNQDEEIAHSVKHLTYMPFQIDTCFVPTTCCDSVRTVFPTPECKKQIKETRKRRNIKVWMINAWKKTISLSQRSSGIPVQSSDQGCPIKHPIDYGLPGCCGKLWREHCKLVHERVELAWVNANRTALEVALKRIRPTSFRISPQHRMVNRHLSKRLGPSCHLLYNNLQAQGLVDRKFFEHWPLLEDENYLPILTPSFLDLMWAIDRSGIEMKSLNAATGLSFLMRHPSGGVLTYYQKALSNLVRLKLEVSFTPSEASESRYRWDDDSHPNRGPWPREEHDSWLLSGREKGLLGKLLQETRNLEILHLKISERLQAPAGGMNDSSLMPIFLANELELLGDLTWNKLKYVKLEGFHLTKDGLLRFIRHHPGVGIYLESPIFEIEDGDTKFLPNLFAEIRCANLEKPSCSIPFFVIQGSVGGMITWSNAQSWAWWQNFYWDFTKARGIQLNEYILGRADNWRCRKYPRKVNTNPRNPLLALIADSGVFEW